jgi:hypothetical protein
MQAGSHAGRQSCRQAVMQAGSYAYGQKVDKEKGLKWRACNSNATAHRSVVKSVAVIDKLTGRQEKKLNVEKSSK